MPPRTVIIHGWSDQSASFARLKEFLEAHGHPADGIYYGDWLSREDNISYDDVVAALNREFHARGFIDADNAGLGDLDVIVHSTGGLIIRHWLARYYFQHDSAAGLKAGLARCPVRNIVMLAPANFGSPLAAMGKSWVGGIVKGTHQLGMHFFATGRQILNGLELGSEYQWALAHRDLIRTHPYFVAGGIQVSVLVGMTGLGGIAGFFADKAGSDGTVVIAGTNLNSIEYRLLPPPALGADQSQSSWEYVCPPLEVAHRVFRGLNHHSITDPANTGPAVLDALAAGAGTGPARASAFQAHVRKLAADTRADYEAQRASGNDADRRTGTAYQQYLVHVRDEPGLDLQDFTLEFLLLRRSRFEALVAGSKGQPAPPTLLPDEQVASVEFQKLMTRDVHPYSQNRAYRSFLIDVASARLAVESAAKLFKEEAVPAFRLYVPGVDDHIYYDLRSLHIVELDAGSAGAVSGRASGTRPRRPDFVHAHTTTLLELLVRRASEDTVWVGLTPHQHP
jgi:hypothetical protein